MRIAILSDIHANLPALTVALRVAESYRVDAVVCLGDIVGYGPDPGPCVDLVAAYCTVSVLGNHDAAMIDERQIRFLPRDAQGIARMHREALTEAQVDFLARLPMQTTLDACTLVHATPQQPEAWHRLQTYPMLRKQFAHFDTPFCLIGHTHVPMVVAEKIGTFTIRPGGRYLINPGSVGQPRDGDPRLSIGILDTRAYTYKLVRKYYDVEDTIRRMRVGGWPTRLVAHLRKGSA